LGGTRLLSNVLASIRCFVDGSLWIGYRYGGVSTWHNGVLRHSSDAAGLPHEVVRNISRDRSGRTWVLTSTHLLYQDGDHWRDAGKAWGLNDRARSTAEDAAGALLVFDQHATWRLDEVARRFVPAAIPATRVGTMNDNAGGLWSVMDNGSLQRVPATVAGVKGTRHPEYLPHAEGPMFDADGNLWDVESGISRRTPAQRAGLDALTFPGPESLDSERYLTGPPMTLLNDREGNIWVGMRLGVDRFRHNRFCVRNCLPMPQI
jgi:ligand-binding sensor domain-containing protein